ncbi:hypothetical protein P4533_15665 [Geobacillus stearothermophilus]|nr:hypothetical protein [Geobacillus stearothermophilus]
MIEFLAEYLMTNRMGGKKMKKVVSLGLAFSLALGGVLPTLSVEPSKVEASSYEFTKEQQEALNYI